MNQRPVVDVAVIGGGPAGATAARLLCEWGHSVVLLQRPAGPHPPLAVSIPPSTRKILAAVGALAWIEDHGFLRTTGNTSWWDSAAPRVEGFSAAEGGTGFQVLRSELEDLLLRRAAAAGVVVRDDGRVRGVRFEDPDAATVEVLSTMGRGEEVRARRVLDASGRAGVLARRFRRKDGPVTLALAAVWRQDGGFPVADDSHTLVEAYDGGWAWSVPVARGLRHVTVMVDPPRPAEARRDLAALYATELRRARHLEAIVAAGLPVGAPWAADASTYGAAAFEAPRLLLVGDAGSFIDPLSSYGVKKALASAWLAAVATHTGLRHPERDEVARTFFSRREEKVHGRYAHETARYAAQAAARYPGSAFWRARAAPPAAARDDPDEGSADQGAVQRAFETLKGRKHLDLELGSGVRIALAPLVVDHEIALADALHPPHGNAVHFVVGLDAVMLARLAPQAREVGELFAAYNRSAARTVEVGEFLLGLATLVASGLVQVVPAKA